MQRITKSLNRKCNLIYGCTRDLTLVFRGNGDSGDVRLCTTPKPDKWTKISDCHRICAFTSETIHAIKNLIKHIMYGCISDIPPGAGTNRNERFHHHINSLLNRSKVGILLAYAFLTVVIHAYNHSSKRKSRLVIEPISNSKISNGLLEVQELTPVGILPKIVTIYKKSLRKLQLFKAIFNRTIKTKGFEDVLCTLPVCSTCSNSSFRVYFYAEANTIG